MTHLITIICNNLAQQEIISHLMFALHLHLIENTIFVMINEKKKFLYENYDLKEASFSSISTFL